MANIICRKLHSFFIDFDGIVWACGQNHRGQLGLGHKVEQLQFSFIPNLPPIIQVSGLLDCESSFLLDHQGGLWVCGDNTNGQLGVCSERYREIVTPMLIPNLPFITMVSCGGEHIIILDNEGGIWGIGDNQHGQLSISYEQQIEEFTRIDTTETGKVVKVRCGLRHSIIETESGDLWGCGGNFYGLLGINQNEDVVKFQRIETEITSGVQEYMCGYFHSVVLDKEGRVWITGDKECCGGTRRYKFTQIENVPPIQHIVSGGGSTIMTDESGIVYVFGYTNIGGSGEMKLIDIPQVVPTVLDITQGALTLIHHAHLVDKDGNLWASGKHYHGTGLAETQYDFKKVQVVKVYSASDKRFQCTKRAHQ